MIIWVILGENNDDKPSLILGGCVHIFSVSPGQNHTHRIRRNSPQGEYVVVGNKSCSLFLANETVLKVVARAQTSSGSVIILVNDLLDGFAVTFLDKLKTIFVKFG